MQCEDEAVCLMSIKWNERLVTQTPQLPYLAVIEFEQNTAQKKKEEFHNEMSTLFFFI